jgi:transcriptional regulator with XRE-family HTH domain
MRKALGTRDVATVFRILQRYGLSQRAISARAGMAQSEVCDILKGRRRVTTYEIFVRIADGDGLPRAWLGVAYDQATEEFVKQSQLVE